jgi:hypothetical protein
MAYGAKTLAGPITTAGAVSATNVASVPNLGEMVNLTAILDVTAAATDSVDVLAVWLQGNPGGVWTDLGRFADVLGNGGAVQRVLRILGTGVNVQEEAVQNGALTAGSVRYGPWGDSLRIKYSVTDADADSAFTFSVKAFLEG